MKLKQCCVLGVGLVALFAATVGAQPTVDGTLVGDESDYGTVLSIQNTDTQFGNASDGDPFLTPSGGSEIDQVFGTVVGGRLHMLVTGNLESNFNKLVVLIDSEGGGSQRLQGGQLPFSVDAWGMGQTSPDVPVMDGALQRMGGGSGSEAMGMKFDDIPGSTDGFFGPDHFLSFTLGHHDGTNESVGLPAGTPCGRETCFAAMTAFYADLTDGTAGLSGGLGMQLGAGGLEPGLEQGQLVDKTNNGWDGPDDPNGTPPEHEFVEPQSPNDATNSRNHRDYENIVDLRMAIDNSNVAGVEGASGPPWDTIGDPQNVVTGLEFSIPLAQIGNPAPESEIRVTAFVNGGVYDFASNQFAGVGILEGNLGGGFAIGDVDMTTIAGDQFVTIPVPPGPSGDFNGDGEWNCADIDDLVAEIVAGTNDSTFDMNGDGVVNRLDITDDSVGWLAVGGSQNPDQTGSNPFLEGDADLDGVVDVTDFNVYNNNKFTSTSAWCLADFNADGSTDVSDFNLWNENKFTSSMGGGPTVVPEPASILMLALAATALLLRRRSR